MSPCDFNRRQFLKYTGAAGAATMAASLTMDDAAQAATVAPLRLTPVTARLAAFWPAATV